VPLAAELFDYTLPPHLIAQTPAARRDGSKLLVVNRATKSLAHHLFADLPGFLGAGDVLFRNNAAVLPARLHARKGSGTPVECLLLRPIGATDTWECLLRPGRKLPVGATFSPIDGAFTGTVVAKEPQNPSAQVRFTTKSGEPIAAVAARVGDVPLPPYIERPDSSQREADLARYQTVYAENSRPVAVAAPTAGLHFTTELLEKLHTQGIEFADVTLHVGLGTFKPITTATVEGHAMHRETYELPVATQQALFAARPGRKVAVGTTSVRSIEDFLLSHRQPVANTYIAETGIFIFPPYSFRGVDALITNFHQPRSTLLCLVAAFLAPGSTHGIAWLQQIYREAIDREYRFFSYGDAMLIL
jgi:S-adenosylmethionine:tRNA ribosyltransferase-isomerase